MSKVPSVSISHRYMTRARAKIQPYISFDVLKDTKKIKQSVSQKQVEPITWIDISKNVTLPTEPKPEYFDSFQLPVLTSETRDQLKQFVAYQYHNFEIKNTSDFDHIILRWRKNEFHNNQQCQDVIYIDKMQRSTNSNPRIKTSLLQWLRLVLPKQTSFIVLNNVIKTDKAKQQILKARSVSQLDSNQFLVPIF